MKGNIIVESGSIVDAAFITPKLSDFWGFKKIPPYGCTAVTQKKRENHQGR